MSSIDTINDRLDRLRSSSSNDTIARRLTRFAGRFVERVEFMLEKRRSRRALLELSDEQLKDIGVSRADAVGEAARPFWD